ncbi:MAG: NYN domain-containing protein [Nitrososphaerales archaeon]
MTSNDRVMFFFDGPNFSLSQRGYNSKYAKSVNIDILKMRNFLVGNRKLVASLYFDSRYPGPISEGMNSFNDFLIAIGFRLQFSNLKAADVNVPDPARRGEKGVDVNLAVEMVAAAYEDIYDVAILVSGDGDYYDAVSKVMLEREKQVEVASFKDSCSKIFFEVHPKITYFDEIIEEIKQ